MTTQQAESPTLHIRFRNRVFPDAEPSQASAATSVEISTHESTETLERELHPALQSLLDWASVGEAKQTPANLFELYNASLNQVSEFQRDIAKLAEAMFEANVEFRVTDSSVNSAARKEVLTQAKQEYLEDCGLEFSPVRSIASADLAAEPGELIQMRLERHLNETVKTITREFFALLEWLVASSVAGLVEWTSANTCRYHFFRRVIIQEHAGRTVQMGAISGFHGSRTQKVTETERGQHTHRLARHEHHAIEAFHTTLENTKVVIPLNVMTLVNAVPDWLTPFVRVIDGTLIRELIIERDVKTEDWSQTTR